jgi:hypothetical protein
MNNNGIQYTSKVASLSKIKQLTVDDGRGRQDISTNAGSCRFGGQSLTVFHSYLFLSEIRSKSSFES